MTDSKAFPKFIFTKKMLAITILVGVLVGIGSLLFFYLLKIATEILLGLAGYYPPEPYGEAGTIVHVEPLPFGSLLLLFMPAIGGFVSGYMTYKFAPETAGDGTDAAIKAIHKKQAKIDPYIPPLKAITSSILIGSGGSAGREGPISQIGAGTGAALANVFKLSEREREILAVAGLAAGIGSIFRSPLGGSIFGIEVLYKRDYEVEALVPAVLATFVAYITYALLLGIGLGWVTPWQYSWAPIFKTKEEYSFHPNHLLFFAIMGMIAGVLAKLYVVIYRYVQRFFDNMTIPLYWKTTIGGLSVGVIGVLLGLPLVFETGYGWVQEVLLGNMALELLLIAIFAKMVATALSVGSGGSGGMFAPSLVIGGFMGGAIGIFFNELFPGNAGNVEIYIIIGMGSFFAAAAKVPLASIIMVAEMTGDYNVLPAAFLASIIAYLVSGDSSIYEQLDARYSSPIHEGEFIAGVLERLKVKNIVVPDTLVVLEDMTIRKLEEIFVRSHRLAIPVVSKDEKFIGIVKIEDVLSVPPEYWDQRKARDIIRCKFISVNPDDSLLVALYNILMYELPEIPVVDPKTKELMGEVSFRDIIKFIHYKVEEYFQSLKAVYITRKKEES